MIMKGYLTSKQIYQRQDFEIKFSLAFNSHDIIALSKILICNHHGADISVIWFVERSAIKLLILIRKNKLGGPEKFHCYTTLVSLFEIRLRSLFFWRRKKKTMQWSYENTLRTFITDLFKWDAFRLYRDWNKLMINQ